MFGVCLSSISNSNHPLYNSGRAAMDWKVNQAFHGCGVIELIVAYDEMRVIGNNGSMPWHISEDLKLFKQRTMGHVILMGKNTWRSLPRRPLPGRTNVVLSRTWSQRCLVETVTKNDETAYIVSSLEEAVRLYETKFEDKTLFIIGGGQIYKEAIDRGIVDVVWASEVKGVHEGDTYFPMLEWEEVSREDHELFTLIQYRK
jgi:dihydrofolate reductase